VLLTARRPSRMASLICASVWSEGPCAQNHMHAPGRFRLLLSTQRHACGKRLCRRQDEP
jgi:hypothetical protein